jgi:tetratricopeptide (TPR) repeat protein
MSKKLLPAVADHLIPITGILVTIILVTVAYSNIAGHQFLNWDDIDYILKNERIKSFSIDNIMWMFGDFSMANWHPLTWLSYAFNYALWAKNPLAYKITNIVIHTINSILVYAVTLQIITHIKNNFHCSTASRFSLLTTKELQYASIITAIMFGVHPIHVESVTWISERKDVLYSLFFLLTVYFYIKHRESDNDRKWLLTSIFMFLFSLMSKPMSVTTPLILILIDIYPLNTLRNKSTLKESAKSLLANKITFFLLALLVSIITLLTQSAGIQGAERLAIDSRIINASMSILQYVYHFFWPVNLSTFYSFHPWSTDPGIYSILPVAIVSIITIWFVYLAVARKIYFPIIGWLYFAISLLPVIGIVKVGAQAAADRYTYMPLLSFFILAGTVGLMFFSLIRSVNIRRIAGALVAGSLMATFTHLSHRQNEHWKDDESLWTKAINYSPGIAAVPYSNLGTMYFRNGESRSAIIEFNKSLAINPTDISTMEKVGKAYELMKAENFAIDAYKQLIAAHPTVPTGYIRLGDFYYRKQQLNEAKVLYNKAFYLMPNIPSTLQRSALVDYLDKNYAAAEQKLGFLFKLSPNDVGSLQLLAKVKLGLGEYDEATIIAQRLVQINPRDTFAVELLNQKDNSDN